MLKQWIIVLIKSSAIMKSIFKNSFASSLILVITLFLVSNSMKAQENSAPDAQANTVFQVVDSKDNTSEFAELLQTSGFAPILKKKGPYTVLAPNNEAIEKTDSKLKDNPKKLMKGQLFQGEVSKKQIESQMGVKVQETDKSASNGTVYVVDKVVKQ